MAEIKIEKKAAVWPWILVGLIVLALLLYFLVFNKNDNGITEQATTGAVMADTSDRTAAGTAEESSVHNAVADYAAFINNRHDMGLDHQYSSSALMMLTDAVRSKANGLNVDVNADLDRARQLAEKIKTDRLETTHANSISQAAGILTTAMQTVQQAKFPNLNNEMQGVKRAANNIDPKTEVLNQKEAIKGFFDQSAALLQKM